MSFSDFVSLFVRTATSGRLSFSNAVAAVLATCILCVAVSERQCRFKQLYRVRGDAVSRARIAGWARRAIVNVVHKPFR